MSRHRKWAAGLVLLALVAPAGAAAPAQPKATVEDLTVTVEALKAKLQDYEKRIAELENRSPQSGMSKDEVVKLIEAMNADAAKRSALPNWMQDLKFGGDLRLRYQGDCFSGNDDKNRNRMRFRLRFGVTKTFLDDQMEVGFRLASGEDGYKNARNSGNPTGYSDGTSTNQTFTKFFTEKPIWIDLAYAKYAPNWLKGLTIIGGKMAKPFVHTDLVWDSDLNLEGVWAQYKPKVCENWSPFVNAGYFIVDESQSDHDVMLYMYQVGSEWKVCKDVEWVVAGTFYDYDHFENANVYGNGNHQDGATGRYLAEGFQAINLTNQVKWKLCGLPWSAYFDWVHNCADEDAANPYEDQSDGYAVGLTIGQNKKKGDWSVSYKYAYIEANCTPGAFNDADFGFVNRKGHVWRAAYNLADFLEIGGAVIFTEPIVGSHENERTVSVQGDLVWKF